MARPALRIKVPGKDQQDLRNLLRGGIQQVRVTLRALTLLRLADGMTAPQIPNLLELTPQSIRKTAHRYSAGGLNLLFPTGNVPVPPGCSTTKKSSAWWRWFAVHRPQAKPGGRFV
jgi:hypothetical protein